MKWKVAIEPTPKAGDTKSKIRFAWTPKRIEDIKGWLVRYEVLYVYTEKTVQVTIYGQKQSITYGYWEKVKERFD